MIHVQDNSSIKWRTVDHFYRSALRQNLYTLGKHGCVRVDGFAGRSVDQSTDHTPLPSFQTSIIKGGPIDGPHWRPVDPSTVRRRGLVLLSWDKLQAFLQDQLIWTNFLTHVSVDKHYNTHKNVFVILEFRFHIICVIIRSHYETLSQNF